MLKQADSAADRHAYRHGLSPYAILSSIHTHLYAHHRTCREWFLAIDKRRCGYILDDQLIQGLADIGTHPSIAESAQLRRLLNEFQRDVAGRFNYDEFSRFICQYLSSLMPEPSAVKTSSVPEFDEATAVASVRCELLNRARNYREAFLLVDDARKGCLSFDEFRKRLVQIGVNARTVDSSGFGNALAHLKTDVAGCIQYNDFLQLLHA